MLRHCNQQRSPSGGSLTWPAITISSIKSLIEKVSASMAARFGAGRLDFDPEGLWVSLVGASGSAKPHCCICSEVGQTSAGQILLEQNPRLGRRKLSRCRDNRLHLSVYHSSRTYGSRASSGDIFRTRPHGSLPQAKRLLSDFGLADSLEHRPRELSGGEQRRLPSPGL